MGLFLFIPWINWQGRQAILFDLPARKFHILGLTFWPQDFILLSWMILIAIFGLFLATTISGRVYCGYVCPQTTWTRFFIWIEELTEGSRNQRIKLDQAELDKYKFFKRFQKHSLWVLLSLMTGFTFIGYFVPVRSIAGQVMEFSLTPWAVFWGLFFSFTTYLNAGWMREQLCKYMCPYARFQSAMFDRDTLVVTYDEERGEPRSKKRKNQEIGDCVDCELCVQVCPTGIDIRKGLQYECISCAACIDACDQVMEKYKKPKGLIRYSTQNAVEHKQFKILRPKVFIYGAAFALFALFFLTALAVRVPLEVDVLRERGMLYRYSSAGELENLYQLKLMNMTQKDREYWIRVDDDRFKYIGPDKVNVAAGDLASLPVRLVSLDPNALNPNEKVKFIVGDMNKKRFKTHEESRFISPR
jgi:cytochrome c oxidase accessory protein FixG